MRVTSSPFGIQCLKLLRDARLQGGSEYLQGLALLMKREA